LECKKRLEEEKISIEIIKKENIEYKKRLGEQTNKFAEIENISTQQKNKITELDSKIIQMKNEASNNYLRPPDHSKKVTLDFRKENSITEKGWIYVKGCGTEKNGVPVCQLNINGNNYLVGYAHCHGHGSFFAPVEKGDKVYIVGGVFQQLLFFPCKK
jgi:hypothetical protein